MTWEEIEARYGYLELCRELSAQFGTQFALTNTGGGCMALEARLESGHYILITDAMDSLCRMSARVEFESGNAAHEYAYGYGVGIYPLDEDGEMAGGEAIVFVEGEFATTAELPELVLSALEQLRKVGN